MRSESWFVTHSLFICLTTLSFVSAFAFASATRFFFTCVTRLSFTSATRMFFTCVTWLALLDMWHNVWHDVWHDIPSMTWLSFAHVTWLILALLWVNKAHVLQVLYACVTQPTHMFVNTFIHMCDVTSIHMWHHTTSLVWDIALICMRDITHHGITLSQQGPMRSISRTSAFEKTLECPRICTQIVFFFWGGGRALWSVCEYVCIYI